MKVKKLKRLFRKNYGLAGVIEALLLVALVAIILSIIQIVYIPVIMSDREAEHMWQVENQLSSLKSVIEMQSMIGAIDATNPVVYCKMSLPVTLGVKKLPYFVTMSATGEIKVLDSEDVENSIINVEGLTVPEYVYGIPLTSIEYTAYNNYYLDGRNIKYIMEGGGIILSQLDLGEVMRVGPSISIENRSQDGYIKIYYTIPVFVGLPGKKQDIGLGNTYIYTNYSTHYTHSGTTSYIKILSYNHLNAWYQYLANTTNGLLREYINNGYIKVNLVNYNELDPNSPLCIKIEPDSKNIRIALTITKIFVQVGAGVIEAS